MATGSLVFFRGKVKFMDLLGVLFLGRALWCNFLPAPFSFILNWKKNIANQTIHILSFVLPVFTFTCVHGCLCQCLFLHEVWSYCVPLCFRLKDSLSISCRAWRLIASFFFSYPFCFWRIVLLDIHSYLIALLFYFGTSHPIAFWSPLFPMRNQILILFRVS